jgi:hypothetical protein
MWQSASDGSLRPLPVEPLEVVSTQPTLPDEPPASAKVVADAQGEFVSCPWCREPISASYRYCPLCGEDTDRPVRDVRRDIQPHRGNLILVLGILSLVALGGFAVMPVLFNLIGVVLGVVAWVMGNRDLGRIMRGDIDPAGQSNTKAGRNCGIIGTTLNAFLAIACLGATAIFLFAGFRGIFQ